MIAQYADTALLAAAGVQSVGWIGWIIIGGIAGWIASKIMGTDAQQGILLNIVVGIVGGVLGGFLLRLIGVDVAGGGYWFTFFTALAGACILLFIVKLVTGRRG
ncbi:GlsB/YeaQ/YmgE family stress response membrane protein [Tsukamurella asaccharolytica]|uniref:GlsB/YeaQ/YmgE family stress response membrane protein n=1 Tax=Tsukamurella asaccharolytica TaxID=2592067 RepID=A0A5C5RER1_9ACTN|nr:GlsB/YeaQ/YmgE family stress response membrane protein [Tsukamurella asaccharolytica]TWS21192.1 GlsB/YeaQ/YmgE family stress response membrane protein [Tsukamurella asaccharolytica]